MILGLNQAVSVVKEEPEKRRTRNKTIYVVTFKFINGIKHNKK